MRDDPRIEQRIIAILTGSGLPIGRRAEVAEELRCHLEQLIAAKHGAGLPDERAIEGALADFGSPKVIRKQLRRQQRMLDRRQARAKLRQHIWVPLLVAGVFAIAGAVFVAEIGSPFARVVAGICVFALLNAIMLPAMYVSTWIELLIERPRPREEYHFAASFLKWLGTAVLAMTLLVFFSQLVIAGLAPLLYTRPWFGPHFWSFSEHFGTAWIESPVRNFGICSVAAFAFALGISLYERSRCVDGHTTLTHEPAE